MDEITYCEPGRIFCKAQKVLLAVDGSQGSARAATVAFEIAEMTKSQLFIVHVIPTPSVKQFARMTDENIDEVILKYTTKGEILLEGYSSVASDYGIEVTPLLEKGLPSERIMAVAMDETVDLIVIGHDGLDARRAQIGSTTDRVVKGTDCPVLVVK
ncbi:MAG: universal stress protein [Promethearchaeota archaeon]